MEELVVSQTVSKLESVFTRIHQQRMQDVPICNEKIQVQAVGFQTWQDCYLGVLITPWFMNLMLLPRNQDDWQKLNQLESCSHCFPSGRYQFLVGYESELGKYQSCSLFSPMFEFVDHLAAYETASVVVKELMNEENVDDTSTHSSQIEEIWNGHSDIDTEINPNMPINDNAEHDKEKTFSRRDILRGSMSPDAENT